MPRFFVNVEDPKGFFYPGEVIAGHITVMFDEATKIKKITIKFKGDSRVEWTTGSGDERKFHSNHEEYFENCLLLVEPPKPDEYIILQPGEFHYPFQFQLPPNLPPSTSIAKDGGIGYVHYFMESKIFMKQRNIKDRIASIPFQVVSPPMVLEEIRDLLEPMSHTEEKYFCCLCCKSGPLRLSVTIQKRIHYVDEQIVFSVEIDNTETDELLGKIEAKLKAFFKFTSKSGNTSSIFTNNESSTRLTQGMAPRVKQNWNDITLNIPTHTTPSFENSKCIHLFYFFIVKIDVSFAFDPEVMFPITISSKTPHMVQNAGEPFFNEMLPLPATDAQPDSMIRSSANNINPTVRYATPKYCPPIVTQQPTL